MKTACCQGFKKIGEKKKPEHVTAPALWYWFLVQAVRASMKFGHTDVSTT